ncbi:MAG: carboxypeptidase-like regulatory domain-containing protein, partial [Sphingobacteriaceae bacterium]|nr:carboxypeptidase-like regulatory domain-containing protein [Cytophagaceae bacterium]
MKRRLPTLVLMALLGLFQPGFAQMLAKAQTTRPPQPPARSASRGLSEVLRELKDHYRVDILFFDRTVEGYTVPADAVNLDSKLERNLDVVLKPFGLMYKKSKTGGYVISRRETERREGPDGSRFPESPAPAPAPGPQPEERTTNTALIPLSALAQTARPELTVRGRVTDAASGEGLPGVSILVKGSQKGTTTDGTGNFSLEIPN